MTELELRIFGNANWRADAGKTAANVASELNDARIILAPGSRHSLTGLVKLFGTAFTASIEFKVREASASLAASPDPAQRMQAVALSQLIDVLRIGNGPDFGIPETQASLEGLAGVLSAQEITALQGLGIDRTYPAVTAEEVTAAWSALADFETRQTILADLSRQVGTLSGQLHEPVDFAATLADLNTYLVGL